MSSATAASFTSARARPAAAATSSSGDAADSAGIPSQRVGDRFEWDEESARRWVDMVQRSCAEEAKRRQRRCGGDANDPFDCLYHEMLAKVVAGLDTTPAGACLTAPDPVEDEHYLRTMMRTHFKWTHEEQLRTLFLTERGIEAPGGAHTWEWLLHELKQRPFAPIVVEYFRNVRRGVLGLPRLGRAFRSSTPGMDGYLCAQELPRTMPVDYLARELERDAQISQKNE